MRNFNVFLLFLSLFCCSWRISSAQNCNLPAPTGLTWTYPTQNTVKFTWNSVQGAWGYQIALNAHNTQGQGQTIQAPATEATFTYTPHTTYTVELYAGCSATNFSSQKTIKQFSPDGLIIVVDINPGLYLACPGAQLIWASSGAVSSQVQSSPIDFGKLYQIQLNYQDMLPVNIALQHNNFLSYCATKINLYPNPDWNLSAYASGYFGTHIDKAKVKNNGLSTGVDINTTYDKNIIFRPFGTGLLSNIKVFECSGYRDLPSGGDRSRNSIPTYVASPNPFLNQISVFLKGQAQGMVTAKMLDTAGQLKWIQQYDSASLQDQVFVIQTQDMPAGMYFLQISDARGLLQTQRLIKH